MPAASDIVRQASKLRMLYHTGDDADLLAHADELLLFLNRLRDLLRYNSGTHIPLSSINDIIQRLESNLELTLHNTSDRERLLNLLMKF